MEVIGQHHDYEDAARTIAGLLKTRAQKHGCEELVPDDLREVKVMFETVIENVKLAAHQEGMQKGIQAGIQEGIQAGIQEGIQEGMHRGEAAVLLRLLEHRFGAVAVLDEVRERIAAAEPALLEDWILRVLDAPSLDDVLGDASPSVH